MSEDHVNRKSTTNDKTHRHCVYKKKVKHLSVNPFLNFLCEFRKKMPSSSVTAIAREAGYMWRSMSHEQKRPYFKQAETCRRNKRIRYRLEQRQKIHDRGRSQSSSGQHQSDSFSSIKQRITNKYSRPVAAGGNLTGNDIPPSQYPYRHPSTIQRRPENKRRHARTHSQSSSERSRSSSFSSEEETSQRSTSDT